MFGFKKLLTLSLIISLGCFAKSPPQLEPPKINIIEQHAFALDLEATAKAPWAIGDSIVKGYCSRSGLRCQRFFLGITQQGKVLVQDYYIELSPFIPDALTYNPDSGIIDNKMTEPFTMQTIDDAKRPWFYVDDGKDGPYHSYYPSGGFLEQGDYINGKKHGLWLQIIDHYKSYGHYKDGEQDGIWIDDFADAIWKTTYQHGQLLAEQAINRQQLDDYNQQLSTELIQQYGDDQGLGDFLAITYSPPIEYLITCEDNSSACYEAIETEYEQFTIIKGMTNLGNSKFGLMNQQKEIIIPPEYDRLYLNDDHILAEVHGTDHNNPYKEALLSPQGELLIPAKYYDSIEYFAQEQIAVVGTTDDEIRSYGLFDVKNNKMLLPIKFRSIYYQDGIARVTTHYQNDNSLMMGFYNLTKQIWVEPHYDRIDRFINGIAVVGKSIDENNYKYGLIDSEGREVIPLIYDAIYYDNKRQYAEVIQNRKYGLIGDKGQVIVPVIFDRLIENRLPEYRDEILIAKKAQSFTVYNIRTGKVLLPLDEYEHVWYGEKSHFKYRYNGETFTVDKQGNRLGNKK